MKAKFDIYVGVLSIVTAARLGLTIIITCTKQVPYGSLARRAQIQRNKLKCRLTLADLLSAHEAMMALSILKFCQAIMQFSVAYQSNVLMQRMDIQH